MWLESHVLKCCCQSTAENNKNRTDPLNIQSTEAKKKSVLLIVNANFTAKLFSRSL